MKRQTVETLKAIQKMGARVAALSVLMVASSAAARAQCGDSFNAMARAAALGGSQSEVSQPVVQSSAENESDRGDNPFYSNSIVGLWHISFIAGGNQIQEAFQIWNEGGTEVHNPNVDPRTGSVCLGAWKEAGRTFRLTHRVWLYDANGNYQFTGHLSETLVLSPRGDTQTGSFTLAFYDKDGKFQGQVSGAVVGERISPE